MWEEQGPLVAAISNSNVSRQRKKQLKEQLCIGECSAEDREAL